MTKWVDILTNITILKPSIILGRGLRSWKPIETIIYLARFGNVPDASDSAHCCEAVQNLGALSPT